MADLTRGYNVPGVYVQDATGPLVTNASVPDAVVTLVGPAIGFQTASDAVLASATAQPLSNLGVWLATTSAPAGVFVPVVKNAAGVVLTPGTDYTLAAVFDSNGLNNPAEATTTITIGTLTNKADHTVGTPAVETAGGVKVGDVLFVTYSYTNGLYYSPLLFDDYNKIVATYGAALRQSLSIVPGESPITSPLSLAAAIAFQNGATRVICLATNPSDGTFDAQLRAAYAKTLGDYRVAVVVPLLADGGDGAIATYQSYGLDLKAHVEASSDAGYQRIGILGGQINAVGTVTGVPAPFDEVSTAIASSRVIQAYPNRMSYYSAPSNRVIEVDGYYLAAAFGGVLEANPVNQALTRQQVVGFTGLPASITRINTKAFKDNLSSKGVAVVEVDRQNRLLIRHGLSTDVTNVLTREVSITRARDVLFVSLQIGLDNSGLIGAPIDIEMSTRIKGAVQGILEALVQDETIIAYTDLRVRQQTLAIGGGGDPTVIEVRFAYQPALPLNYVVVTFSLDLTTGQINADTTAAVTG